MISFSYKNYSFSMIVNPSLLKINRNAKSLDTLTSDILLNEY